MEISVYSFPSCSRCKTLRMLLEKNVIKYKDMVVTQMLSDSDDEYPHIFIDGEKVSYHTFLQMLKEGDIK